MERFVSLWLACRRALLSMAGSVSAKYVKLLGLARRLYARIQFFVLRRCGCDARGGCGEAAGGTSGAVVRVHEACRERGQASQGELAGYLLARYAFRYNVLTDSVEYGRKAVAADVERAEAGIASPEVVAAGGVAEASCPAVEYRVLEKRQLNTLVLEAQAAGFRSCWNEDVGRIACSAHASDFHPFRAYMASLPAWDGEDRVGELVGRVSGDTFVRTALRRWLRAMAAQWMGRDMLCANSLVPVLISRRQGIRKSTFCRMLMPEELRGYYLDKFDLGSQSGCERKLAQFGLINLDEMDRYSERGMATLKNLVQLRELKFRRAYSSCLNALPRIASFIATCNRRDILSDPTGSRRFLCIEVERVLDCTPPDHRQLFAQLRAEVEDGGRCWLTADEELELQRRNALFYRLRPEEEAFRRVFRVVADGGEETGRLMRATDIFEWLKTSHPALMRGVTVRTMGRMFSSLGLRMHHRADGNYYRVALCDGVGPEEKAVSAGEMG